MKGVGLVLEGGGMRGIFTAGALDFFLDEKIRFDYIIGVSAGGSNGLSYASGQRGRARVLNSDYLDKYSYIGLKHFFGCGCIMDYNLLFDDFPKQIYPFDFSHYAKKQPRYIMVATSCADGRARYFEKSDSFSETIEICKASCSMPFICKKVSIGGEEFLDGGISDSIPLAKSVADGNAKNVVILTRNSGYRKTPERVWIPPFFYPNYPKLRRALSERGWVYNRELEAVEQAQRRGECAVIRPVRKLLVSRVEKRSDLLKDLYAQGYEQARAAVGANPEFFGA